MRNPILFLLLIILAGGTYVAYNLNLLGPMMQMSSAAWNQAIEIGKQRLREFLENNETARQAIALPARDSDSISRKLFLSLFFSLLLAEESPRILPSL